MFIVICRTAVNFKSLALADDTCYGEFRRVTDHKIDHIDAQDHRHIVKKRDGKVFLSFFVKNVILFGHFASCSHGLHIDLFDLTKCRDTFTDLTQLICHIDPS